MDKICVILAKVRSFDQHILIITYNNPRTKRPVGKNYPFRRSSVMSSKLAVVGPWTKSPVMFYCFKKRGLLVRADVSSTNPELARRNYLLKL